MNLMEQDILVYSVQYKIIRNFLFIFGSMHGLKSI